MQMLVTRRKFDERLIFDIGASNGDDSGYYLHKGFRVVAVEPNPVWIPVLQQRFAGDMQAGRFTLVTDAIAAADGEETFWLCHRVPNWSSLDPVVASYAGSPPTPVQVRTCRLSALLERFGTPFYCKIDIEGSDRLCVEDMDERTKPPFLSVELPTVGSAPATSESARIMDRLEALGYARFKLISQVTYRPASRFLAATKALLPQRLSIAVTRLDRALRKFRSEGGWTFGEESSGPFAQESRGRWMSAAETRRLIAIIQRNRDISDWYDLHAAVSEL